MRVRARARFGVRGRVRVPGFRVRVRVGATHFARGKARVMVTVRVDPHLVVHNSPFSWVRIDPSPNPNANSNPRRNTSSYRPFSWLVPLEA